MENAIFALRQKRGLTMQALAEKAGTTASQINKLEKGERRLTADWMRRLASALDCRPLDILGGEDAAAQNAAHGAPSQQGGAEAQLGHLDALPHLEAGHEPRINSDAWFVPKAVFDGKSKASVKPAIVEVKQRDLEPDVRFGDYVAVDLADTIPTPPGIFIIEEDGQLVLRLCAMQSKLPGRRVKVTAMHHGSGAGAPVKTSSIHRLQDLKIMGRVLGHWHWV